MMKIVLAFVVLSLMALPATAQPDSRPGPHHDGPPPHDRPLDPPPHDMGPGGPGGPGGPHDRDGMHGPPGAGRFPGERGPLSPEEMEVALDTMQRIDPDTATDLRQRYEENPDQVSRSLVERFPRIRMFLKLRKFDPDMFDLRVEDIRLARQTGILSAEYREARTGGDDETTAALEAKLRDLLAERFEIRQRIRQREIEDLEERLVVLREQLEEQAERKEAEIDEQLNRLGEDREKPRHERMDL